MAELGKIENKLDNIMNNLSQSTEPILQDLLTSKKSLIIIIPCIVIFLFLLIEPNFICIEDEDTNIKSINLYYFFKWLLILTLMLFLAIYLIKKK